MEVEGGRGEKASLEEESLTEGEDVPPLDRASVRMAICTLSTGCSGESPSMCSSRSMAFITDWVDSRSDPPGKYVPPAPAPMYTRLCISSPSESVRNSREEMARMALRP